MSPTSGLLSSEQLGVLIDQGDIETVLVGFTDLYGRFMGKRFDADFYVNNVAEHGTHACDYLLTVDMEMEPVPGYQIANWQRGYGDFHLVPDASTLRLASWLDKSALVICDVEDEQQHTPVRQAPRSILRTQIERASEMGLAAKAASELEYYIFRNSYADSKEKGYRDLKPAGWYIEDYHALQGARVEDFNSVARRELSRSGVPVESTKGEWGLGQHELNIYYSDILEMADRHALLKQCLKEIADRQQISITFMAKFAAEQAGSSCHVHMSLWRDDESAFTGEQAVGSVNGSDLFRHFAGGWLQRIPELMVLLAPTVNSYKRYQSGSWAPTRLAWSVDNRTAGVRVVGKGDALRLECRVPGADCNPYLTYAALLAAGLDGIEHGTEPPDLFVGDVYATDEIPRVPGSLLEAVDLFENSEFANRVFGEAIVQHYSHFFRVEQQAYERSVSDWERERYFERI